jgi:hypothetical protein
MKKVWRYLKAGGILKVSQNLDDVCMPDPATLGVFYRSLRSSLIARQINYLSSQHARNDMQYIDNAIALCNSFHEL